MSVEPDRTSRTDEASGLFAEVAITGSVPLGRLTEEQDVVLGGGRWALTGVDAWRAWQERSEDDRSIATLEALRSLEDQGMVTEVASAPGRVEVAYSAPLGLVDVARSHADFLIVPSTRPGTPAVLPYGYAILDEVAGLRGIVIEVRGAGRHDYRLVSPRRAADGFARWMLGAAGSDEWGPQQSAAVVEVMRVDQETPVAAGATVRDVDGALHGAVLGFGARRSRFDGSSQAAVSAVVRGIIEEAARLGSALRR